MFLKNKKDQGLNPLLRICLPQQAPPGSTPLEKESGGGSVALSRSSCGNLALGRFHVEDRTQSGEFPQSWACAQRSQTAKNDTSLHWESGRFAPSFTQHFTVDRLSVRLCARHRLILIITLKKRCRVLGTLFSWSTKCSKYMSQYYLHLSNLN